VTVRLVDRRPALGAEEIVARCQPPARFATVRFSTYEPNPDHRSQTVALEALETFLVEIERVPTAEGRRWFRRDRESDPSVRSARYLDGGFGVGKTHLLASLWFAADVPKAYLTFAELAAVIGYAGMERAIEVFRACRLLCIDEFELDDVANTLMTVTFLRAIIGPTKVVATSNTLPDRLGEGRFAADDFRREIAAIAEHFEVLRIDGPDYRARDRVEAEPLGRSELDRWVAEHEARGARVTLDEFDGVIAHLRQVHPVQVGALLDGVDAVALDGLRTLGNQGDALLFVHLIDELYDSGLPVAASGCSVPELFVPAYRNGGYRKKYGRCESRLGALLGSAVIGSS
jgi:cell division protein ZapE